jgi:hypothetical protein
MSRKEDADPAASELGERRWEGVSAKEKSEHARMMNRARWGEGYVAKRPASSRKTGKPRGRPKKKAAAKKRKDATR